MADKVKVAILMGSKSDLDKMKEASEALSEFGVANEMRVISAHRSPKLLEEYLSTAGDRGIEVFIAGAGGAAHLAGVIAAHTTMPVIGVPVKSKSLDGLDSLLSTVQMPPGVPVAAVGIDSSKNAGILAVQILALKDRVLAEKLEDYKGKMAEKIRNMKI